MNQTGVCVVKPRAALFARHSGIDLLRIIAILLICLFHANQTWVFHLLPFNLREGRILCPKRRLP